MKYNQDIHHRRSIRLKDYDYSQAGAYFMTICTKNRECLFGDAIKEKMILNDAGKMIKAQWVALPKRFPHVLLDEFIVMPNHIHGIIILTQLSDLIKLPPKNLLTY